MRHNASAGSHNLSTPSWYTPKPGTPNAVLVDVDGTIALRGDRDPYDWDRVGEDTPNRPVIAVAHALAAAGNRLIVMSGRPDTCRAATTAWLTTHLGVAHDGPHMRRAGDGRRDAEVKAELFDQHVRDQYTVTAVLDDRRQVVDMWRSIGLLVLHVAEGDF